MDGYKEGCVPDLTGGLTGSLARMLLQASTDAVKNTCPYSKPYYLSKWSPVLLVTHGHRLIGLCHHAQEV